MPRAKNFSPSVTRITTPAMIQFHDEPNSGLPIAGTPPAEY